MSQSGSNRGEPFGGGRQFSTTHWSVVLTASRESSPEAQEALAQLCRTYWFPLYAYVRRHGHSPEDAQDLTQEFLVRFLTKDCLSRASRDRGRFRTFLLTSLQNFLRHEWERAQAEKRGGGKVFISWEREAAEERYQAEVNPGLTPDQIFDQRWAMALFQHALSRLQQESVAAGKTAQFEELKGFLSTQTGDGAYDRVASRLGLAKGAVAVAVHRLRQHYGELVREEIAHTVTTPAEVDEEMHYLIKLMSV